MERLGVKNCSEIFRNIRTGDSIRAKVAGCVNSFQKRISKTATNMLFWNCPTPAAVLREYCFRKVWHGMRKSLLPAAAVCLSITIDKQSEEANPRVMFNVIETLDKAISEVANGLEIAVNDVKCRSLSEGNSRQR